MWRASCDPSSARIAVFTAPLSLYGACDHATLCHTPLPILPAGARFFAAKEIRYAELKASEVEDILCEVAVLQALNHQHIVHLKESWLDGSRVVLVQELLEGVDGFAAVLTKGSMSDDRAKEV